MSLAYLHIMAFYEGISQAVLSNVQFYRPADKMITRATGGLIERENF